MLDNQTRMRAMLNLIESVDQGKKLKLNESIGEELSEDSGSDPRQLAQEALSAAVRYIQDALEVSEEDEEIAYEYFRDENAETVLDIFVEYIEHQVDAQHNGDAPPNDDF
jgi:hypothetical protein